MKPSPKHTAIRLIEELPDDVSLEDIMYELYFRHRIDRGLEELDQGQTISHEELKRSLAVWLRSSGRYGQIDALP